MKKSLPYIIGISSLFACQKDESIIPEPKETTIEYYENVKKIDSKDILKIDGLDKNSFYFSDNLELKEGDVLLFGASELTPNGLMKKIETLDESSKKATTSNASLEEIIRTGNIHSEKKLTHEDLIGATTKAEGLYDFQKEINEIIYDADGNYNTTNDQIRFVGDLYFNCGYSIDADFNSGLKDIKSKAYVSGVLEAKLEGDLERDFNEETKIIDLTFHPIPIGTTGLFVTPSLDVYCGMKGFVDSKFNMPFYAEGNISTELFFQEGEWSSECSKDFSFDCEKPKFGINGEVTGYISPRMTLSINQVIGPFVEIEEYMKGEFDILKNPTWEVKAGVNANIGCDAGLFSFMIPEYKKTILNYEIPVKSGENIDLPKAKLESNLFYGDAPIIVEFDASQSTSGARIDEYFFNFDDGNIYSETKEKNDGIFDGKTTHEYLKYGDYFPNVTIKDSLGRTSKDSIEVILNQSQIELSYDDGLVDSTFSYDGFCKSSNLDFEECLIKKYFDLPKDSFWVNEIQIYFTKKPSSEMDYHMAIKNENYSGKGFYIKYDDVELNTWYIHKFEDPVLLFYKPYIYGRNYEEIHNCGDSSVFGWGIGIDTDNSGHSAINKRKITPSGTIYINENETDYEFMIRLIGE